MTDQSEVPVDLYIAAYNDPNAAQADWDAIKELAHEKVITVEALVLVSRDMDGKMVGAGIGAGIGGLVSHAQKKDIKEEVADSLPPGSSGIVALFDERWVAEVEKATANADKVAKHEVDRDSAEEAKKAAAGAA